MDRVAIGNANQLGNEISLFRNGELDVFAARPYIDRDGSVKIWNAQSKKGMHVNTPATLRYDEWKDIDRKVIEISTQRLKATAAFISRGLTYNLGSIAAVVALWQRSSDMTGADITMDGISEGEEDRVNFDYTSVPVPIIHKDFRVNLRHLEASRKMGQGVDTIQASIAARVVAEKTEDMILSSQSIQVDGGTIYGLLNHPDRNTASLPLAWDNASKTGALILTDVITMITALKADRHYGPYLLLVPQAYEQVLDTDYRANDNRTVRQRIMALEGIAGIEVVDRMTANNIVMVQLTDDVIDIAIAQDTTTVQWATHGGLQQKFKVMSSMVPRVKSDYDSRSGICHMS